MLRRPDRAFRDLKGPASLLAAAFSGDPWIQKLFHGDEDLTRHFFEFILASCESSGGKVLTEYRNAEDGPKTNPVLASVACLEVPRGSTSRPNLIRLLKALLGFMAKGGWKTLGLLNAYMRLTTRHRPKSPHHYLVCIGVDPQVKGMGMGKSLLDAIHRLVDEDPASTGIGLDTENANNIALYEHFGYRLTGTESLDGMTIYTLFRAKNPKRL